MGVVRQERDKICGENVYREFDTGSKKSSHCNEEKVEENTE